MSTSKKGIVDFRAVEYKTVALRVHEFREKYPIEDGWGIDSKIVHVDAETVLFRAAIVDPQGREVGVGFEEEKRTIRGVNSSSALENCQTSAVGRALATVGFAGTAFASADELVNALKQQREAPTKKHPSWTADNARAFIADLEDIGLTLDVVSAYCESKTWRRPSSWNQEDRLSFILDLKKGNFPALYQTGGAA